MPRKPDGLVAINLASPHLPLRLRGRVGVVVWTSESLPQARQSVMLDASLTDASLQGTFGDSISGMDLSRASG